VHESDKGMRPNLRARVSYVFELDKAELAEVHGGPVSGPDEDDELHETHLLRSHVIHRRQPIEDLHPSSREREGIEISRAFLTNPRVETILKAFSHKLGFKQSLQA